MEQIITRVPLGRKIRFVRTLKGYSQEYMAMRMSISQNAYSKMERGSIRIKPDRFRSISHILGMPPYAIARIGATSAGEIIEIMKEPRI